MGKRRCRNRRKRATRNYSTFHTRCQVTTEFIHSGYFYSASSSPLLLRSAPDTAQILCLSFTPKCHRQLLVKDLPNFPTWWPERDSNPRYFGLKASNLPMRHHAPLNTNMHWHSIKHILYFISHLMAGKHLVWKWWNYSAYQPSKLSNTMLMTLNSTSS